MNYTLGHSVLSSAKTYFDYRLIADLSAFSNKTVNLYNYQDPKFANLKPYGGSYYQWNYHSGYGATVASGYYNPGFTARNTGIFIDFNNGRVLSNITLTGSPTAQVSVREINSYLTTYSDSQIIAENNFLQPPNLQMANSYAKPYSQAIPAAFFRLNTTNNEPLSLGGKDWTTYQVRILCAMNDNFKLTAIADMVRDMKNRVFPIITGSYAWPFNEYGDIKSGWDYNSYLNSPPATAFIDRTNFAYLQNDFFAEKNPRLEIGIGTLDIRVPRNPHG